MFLTIKKVIGLGAALIFVAAWFYSGALENTYVYYPRTPEPSDGKVIPYPVKGIVVYITKDQQSVLSWLTWIEIGSGAIAACVILLHGGDPFKAKRKPPN